jgi:hypothetical protein
VGRIFVLFWFFGGGGRGLCMQSDCYIYVYSYYYVCVLILVYVCPHATMYVKMKEEVGGQSVVCVRVRLYNTLLILYYY